MQHFGLKWPQKRCFWERWDKILLAGTDPKSWIHFKTMNQKLKIYRDNFRKKFKFSSTILGKITVIFPNPQESLLQVRNFHMFCAFFRENRKIKKLNRN